jgi:uncharacterized protein (TIGR00661 family)
MKILYAIQGTGNGHVTRARDIYPELCKWGEVDILLSGVQADVKLPFPVKYKLHGASFIFGSQGGVDMKATAKAQRPLTLIRDILRLPVKDYDLIVNDFEPVSAWACRLRGKTCVSLSHQWAVIQPSSPLPASRDRKGSVVLKRYAPVSAGYGFHFQAYGPNIYPPVIRGEVRALKPTDAGHYTVYLPSYDDATLVNALMQFPGARWQVFSKHNRQPVTEGNVSVQPIDNAAFLQSMASSSGVLCGAGFEGPAEALYLRKKLLVIPMANQYEQQCNAAALAEMGVSVAGHLGPEYHDLIRSWITSDRRVKVDYPDRTAEIIAQLVRQWEPRR